MKICFTLLYYDINKRHLAPRDLLQEHAILRHLPQAVAELGHQVHVVHQYPQADTFVEGRVRYHFVASGWLAQGLGRGLGQWRWNHQPSLYEPAWPAIRRIQQIQPDVLHFHGLTPDMNLALLQRALPQTPLMLHFHGGQVPASGLLRRLRGRNLRGCTRVLFSTLAHAGPFVDAGLLQPHQIAEVLEVSSHFAPLPQQAARQMTQMRGTPVFLSVGRLSAVKDPLTMLAGFAKIAQAWPQAQLYLYYLDAPLLDSVRAYIQQRAILRERVHLRGRVALNQMPQIYSSADFLLQASQRELGGYAVLEAMACGVIPIVTDIPSFRAMTADGRFGRLFPVGSAPSLAEQVLTLDESARVRLSQQIRDHFEKVLGYHALARHVLKVYTSLF